MLAIEALTGKNTVAFVTSIPPDDADAQEHSKMASRLKSVKIRVLIENSPLINIKYPDLNFLTE